MRQALGRGLVFRAVRLPRGRSSNRSRDVHNVLVTAGTGIPTSGLISGADH
ncbi:hypothetical protein HUT06_34200 [Actinomadura sp. NAK00032]|uniref:hypothetical protein n=1 Tax=Actinomadura sp. NAK00032 TaxID=2742128 RepID=UPI00158FC34B|nr:hypothetical protein [Actinomadura sp. NAK00032]QKW38444.1 hypothetical protein HUT06_34200 [Actinomadura sp. NAK00032]